MTCQHGLRDEHREEGHGSFRRRAALPGAEGGSSEGGTDGQGGRRRGSRKLARQACPSERARPGATKRRASRARRAPFGPAPNRGRRGDDRGAARRTLVIVVDASFALKLVLNEPDSDL